MTTITIPKKLEKEKDLVVIPRKKYEEFSRWQKMFKTFKPSAGEKADLKKARMDYKAGRVITIDELKRKLAAKN